MFHGMLLTILNLQFDIHQSTAELTGPSLDSVMTFSTG